MIQQVKEHLTLTSRRGGVRLPLRRASEEATAEASCTTECTTTANVIAAETELSLAALAELNASSLTGAALGELQVDLTFGRMEQ